MIVHIKELMCLKMRCHSSTIQEIHKNLIGWPISDFSGTSSDPFVFLKSLSYKLIILSIEALQFILYSSGAQDYYTVVRDTESSHSYKTKSVCPLGLRSCGLSLLASAVCLNVLQYHTVQCCFTAELSV